MSQAALISVTSGNSNIPTSFVGNSGTAVPVANQLNIVGSSPITTSCSGSTVTISSSGSSSSWNAVSGTSQALVSNNNYYCQNAGLTTLTLPASPVVGQEIKIQGTAANTGTWIIAQNAGQSIVFGARTTTVGTGGSIQSTQASDGISLLCVDSTTFNVTSSIGNFLVT